MTPIGCGKTFDQTMAGFGREHARSEVAAVWSAERGSEGGVCWVVSHCPNCISEGLVKSGQHKLVCRSGGKGCGFTKVLLRCLQPET